MGQVRRGGFQVAATAPGCPTGYRFHITGRPHGDLGLLPEGGGPSHPQAAPLPDASGWAQRGPELSWGSHGSTGPCQDLLPSPPLLTLPLALNQKGSSAGASSELFLMKFLKGEKPLFFSPDLNPPQCGLVANVNISEIQSAGCLPGHRAVTEAAVNPNSNKQTHPRPSVLREKYEGQRGVPGSTTNPAAVRPHLPAHAGSVGWG